MLLQKVKIKKITVMLDQDCLKTLRKISKAFLKKVNLEARATVGSEIKWNIIFLKKKPKTKIQTALGWQDFALTRNFQYVLQKCLKLYFQ